MKTELSLAQAALIRLSFEGYCDAGLGGAREALEEEYDILDAYSALADLGLELCGECGIWHDNGQCSTASPDDASLYICDTCARDRGLI